MPALPDAADVQADQVGFVEPATGRRDAMHDLVVDRRADRAREPAVALEGGDRPGGADHLLGDRVEVGGGDAVAQLPMQSFENLHEDPARLPHPRDLVRTLDGDLARARRHAHPQPTLWLMPSASRIRAVTSSIVPRPSMRDTLP